MQWAQNSSVNELDVLLLFSPVHPDLLTFYLLEQTSDEISIIKCAQKKNNLCLPIAIINRHAEKPEGYSRELLVFYSVAGLLQCESRIIILVYNFLFLMEVQNSVLLSSKLY